MHHLSCVPELHNIMKMIETVMTLLLYQIQFLVTLMQRLDHTRPVVIVSDTQSSQDHNISHGMDPFASDALKYKHILYKKIKNITNEGT